MKDRKQFKAQVNEEQYVTTKDAFEAHADNQKVLVACTGIFSKQNQLDSIKDVVYVVMLNDLDLPTIIENYINF